MTPATLVMIEAPAIGDERVFKPSPVLSVGVELELQILNALDGNRARDAADLIRLVDAYSKRQTRLREAMSRNS